MENNTTNSDEIINSAITDPDGTMQKLDAAKGAIQQLLDKKKELETSGNNTQQQPVKEGENEWHLEDTIDHLLQSMTGYTFYKEPWDERNRMKGSGNRYNINDEAGETVKSNASEEDVIDYANTVYHYDMADNDAEEFKTFDEAKAALEHDNFKVINVADTKQMSLFPDKKKEVEPVENKVISKMDDAEYNHLISRFGGESGVLNKVVTLLKSGNQTEAYNELRKQKDQLRENDLNNLMEYFAKSDIFRIIAESERPKLTKQEILEFIINKKNA